jgi:hypothetical protein
MQALKDLSGLVIIDEVQKKPGMFDSSCKDDTLPVSLGMPEDLIKSAGYIKI